MRESYFSFILLDSIHLPLNVNLKKSNHFYKKATAIQNSQNQTIERTELHE